MKTGSPPNEHSDSNSSDGEDYESESTDSAATSAAILPQEEALTLSGIGTINMDNCLESHIGPKIVTDNLNIIVNNPKDFRNLGNIMKSIPHYKNQDFLKEIGCNEKAKNGVIDEKLSTSSVSWKHKRLPCFHICVFGPRKIMAFCLGFLMMVIVVTAVVFFWSSYENDSGNGSKITTTEITPTTVTPPTTVTEPTTVTAPTTVTTTTTVTSPTSWPTLPTPAGQTGQLIARDSWNGMSPPFDANCGGTVKGYIALDNLQGDHCASLYTCQAILKQREKAENGPLNYNFLIDDSGNVYEARGWDYMSDPSEENSDITVKVAFIGGYSDHHITPIQEESFTKYIQKDFLHVLEDAEMEAQCCRGQVDGMGPDENVICDMRKLGYIKAEKCTKCKWKTDNICHK